MIRELPQFTGADLIFNAERHEYRFPLSGVTIPSVTQILAATGVSTDFEELRGISSSLSDAIDRKRAIGHAIHADAHAYDDGDLIESSVHPDVRPYLEAWKTFRGNQRFAPIHRERKVYSRGLNTCGTLDGIFQRIDERDRRILIDIKIGDPEASGAQFQTAGYEILWTEEHPEQPIAERWSVQLIPGIRIPYRIANYSSWPDAWLHGQKFRAFVTTYWEQAIRRLR